MDRRQKRTREAVFQAFTQLLERKSYSSISVQEIIDAANIGRSTFYTHFETKDELLRALCAEIFDHVFSEHLTCESSHDFSAKQQDIHSEITHILYHLQDSRSYIKGILSCESGEIFMQFFKDHLTGVFQGELEKYPSEMPRDFMLNHIICDFTETVRWWMQHPAYSPEQISVFFFSTTPFAKDNSSETPGPQAPVSF